MRLPARRCLVVGAILLVAPGLAQPPPIRVAGRCSFAPPAGNALQPAGACVDTRRNRLVVLCAGTRSLAAVDLRAHRVVRVVPLADYARGLTPVPAMLYDSRTDRVVVHGEQVISVEAATLRARVVFRPHVLHNSDAPPPVALIPSAGEIVVDDYEGEWSEGGPEPRRCLRVLDVRTLHVKRTLAVRGAVEWMDFAPSLRALVVLEEPRPWSGAWPPPVRFRAVSLRDGRTLARSSARWDRVYGPVVDDRGRRLLFWRSTWVSGRGSVLQGLVCLRLPTLQDASDTVAPLDAAIGQVQPRHALLDARSRRLVYTSSTADPQYLALGSFASARLDAHGVLRSQAGRPLAVDPLTGDVIVARGHGVAVVDGRSLRAKWHARLGAQVADVLVDRRHHRALAWGVSNSEMPWLAWADGSRPRFLPSGPGGPSVGWSRFDYTGVRFAGRVDLSDMWVVHSWDIYPGPFYKGPESMGETSDMVYELVLGPTEHHVYELLFPKFTDLDDPRTAIGIWSPAQDVRRVEIGRGGLLTYVPGCRELFYLARPGNRAPWELRALGRPAVRLPAGTPTLQALSAADPRGEFLYALSQDGRQALRLRTADGTVAAARRLPFAATGLVADESAGTMYLIDKAGGAVVRARTF